jgi:hypothetical protein
MTCSGARLQEQVDQEIFDLLIATVIDESASSPRAQSAQAVAPRESTPQSD